MKNLLTFHASAIQKLKRTRVRATLLLLLAICAGCGRGPSAISDQVRFTPERIQELVRLLNSKNGDSGMGFDLRVAAAEQLSEVGPRATEFGAVPALEKLSKHRDPKLKQAAHRALNNIRPK